jgi:hypothetical protein
MSVVESLRMSVVESLHTAGDGQMSKQFVRCAELQAKTYQAMAEVGIKAVFASKDSGIQQTPNDKVTRRPRPEKRLEYTQIPPRQYVRTDRLKWDPLLCRTHYR